MDEKEIRKIVRVTIDEIDRLGRLRSNEDFRKTEKILYTYPSLPKNSEFKKSIDKILSRHKKDKYYKLIELRYFKNWKFTKLADYYNVELNTITYHKKRLIKMLSIEFFSEKVISEVFEKRSI